jgi:hypothetical protein
MTFYKVPCSHDVFSDINERSKIIRTLIKAVNAINVDSWARRESVKTLVICRFHHSYNTGISECPYDLKTLSSLSNQNFWQKY